MSICPTSCLMCNFYITKKKAPVMDAWYFKSMFVKCVELYPCMFQVMQIHDHLHYSFLLSHHS
ncbi:hypothetical protein COE33_20125 [Bacillus anthracis]|nr:hypothetical protein COE33_20125 [Bacillus anthracis]